MTAYLEGSVTSTCGMSSAGWPRNVCSCVQLQLQGLQCSQINVQVAWGEKQGPGLSCTLWWCKAVLRARLCIASMHFGLCTIDRSEALPDAVVHVPLIALLACGLDVAGMSASGMRPCSSSVRGCVRAQQNLSFEVRCTLHRNAVALPCRRLRSDRQHRWTAAHATDDSSFDSGSEDDGVRHSLWQGSGALL